MKLKKIIASVSAAAMVIGCMPTVWAEGADVPEEGVSVLPADFEPVTYNVADMPQDGFHIVNPYVNDAVIAEVELPEKTKDISICFDVNDCDYTFSAWCGFAGNNWETYAWEEYEYINYVDNKPEFVFNQSGSYELIIPIGLFLEEDEYYFDYDHDYLEDLQVINMRFEGDFEESKATVTITDVKAYQKSHTIKECSFISIKEPEPDEPEEPDEPDPEPDPEPIDGEYNDFRYTLYSQFGYKYISINGYTGKDKDIVIPEEIEGIKDIRINSEAFKDLTFIETVKIPSSVTEVSYHAFAGCDSLKAINVDENNANYASSDGVLFDKDKTVLYCYPAGKSTAYSVPEGIEIIGSYAFAGNTALTSVVLPKSKRDIWGKHAFKDCTSLSSVMFLSDSTTLLIETAEKGGGLVFPNCPNLTIYCYENSATHKHLQNEMVINMYTNQFGKPLSYKLLGKEAAVDTENGIVIENPNLEGTTLTVTVADGSTDTKITYNITLKDENGNEIQPQGDVTVKIPLPEGWDGAKTIVSRHETDGTYTNMNAVFENGYMVFVTEHFSEYVLSYEELEPDAPAAENTAISDSTTASDGTTTVDDENKPTGLVIGIVPAIIAGAAVVLSKKRK